jgi:transcriptional regulator GlxA family with amidase domain
MNSRLDSVTDWNERAQRLKYRVGPLAKDCRINKRQLLRFFLFKFGSSPQDWLTEQKFPGACAWDVGKA